jgi:hypothetical protein
MAITDDDAAFFAKRETTLADIKAAGWEPYFSSGGGWWFARQDDRRVPDHFVLPRWVYELESRAEKRGIRNTRGNILHALGITDRGPGKASALRCDVDSF